MNPTQSDGIARRLDALGEQVAYLVDRQRRQEELFAEMGPILREVMSFATVRLDELDRKGLFRFARELGGVAERVLEGYTAEDVRALGGAIVTILDTVRALTQPQVLDIMGQAAQVLQHADSAEPIGLVGMIRATRNDDVQKGMAVLMDVLRHVGKAAQALSQEPGAAPRREPAKEPAKEPADRKARLAATLGPRRAQAALAGAPARPPAAAAQDVVLDGVAFNPDGHLADPSVWTRELAERLAAVLGIEMTAERWRLVEFARADFEQNKAAPNIRRITQGTGFSTKDLYALFPKAPARTIARIAGTPKPAGCI